jgi:hypothetical protein
VLSEASIASELQLTKTETANNESMSFIKNILLSKSRFDNHQHQRFWCICYIIPDILAIEACSTIQNLLDKRSRFAPSTHSMMCLCPIEWLLAPITPTDLTPRWRTTGVIPHEPFGDVAIPVREMRVLYGLKNDHYKGFARHQLPHAHEFFVPMETLTEENSEENPALRALIARTSVSNNFFSP